MTSKAIFALNSAVWRWRVTFSIIPGASLGLDSLNILPGFWGPPLENCVRNAANYEMASRVLGLHPVRYPLQTLCAIPGLTGQV